MKTTDSSLQSYINDFLDILLTIRWQRIKLCFTNCIYQASQCPNFYSRQGRRVCDSWCLFVSLAVSKITQKFLNGFKFFKFFPEYVHKRKRMLEHLLHLHEHSRLFWV